MGGLKATFLTDFLHTTIALIILIYFAIAVLTNEHVGGIYGLYDKVKAAEDYIVSLTLASFQIDMFSNALQEGNFAGSLLSAKSKKGQWTIQHYFHPPVKLIVTKAVLFGVVLKFGNLALVLMDTAFWQKSFASEVSATVPGYDLASIVIIAIPWCTGTIFGLTARAIEKTPVWILYPETLTATQVNSGLVMPYVLKSLLGTGATAGLLVLIFMAITSTVSSSMIAVSSIISLDFFRTYINPFASDKKTLKISHLGVVGHGCFMAGFAIMLEYAGATNNWSTYFRPIISCPGIFPLALTLLWDRQTKAAAIGAPVLGLLSALATWLALSWLWGGTINIETTQLQMPGLYAATVAFFSPAVYSVIISLAWPQRFDWREFLRIDLIEDKSPFSSTLPSTTAVNQVSDSSSEDEKKSPYDTADVESPAGHDAKSGARHHQARIPIEEVNHPFDEKTIRSIKRWEKIAAAYFVVNILTTVVLWPLPLYRDYIFSKSFFGGWVGMALVSLPAASMSGFNLIADLLCSSGSGSRYSL